MCAFFVGSLSGMKRKLVSGFLQFLWFENNVMNLLMNVLVVSEHKVLRPGYLLEKSCL